MVEKSHVNVVGAGLAGCEAAWQLAEAGLQVHLWEMKPTRRTPAQSSDFLAELVCSNSLRSRNVQNAVGLLKEEMHRLGSLIIQAAEASQVPAGDALAVDREKFAAYITQALSEHANICLRSEIVTELPTDAPTIVATGPLTADELAQDIAKHTGRERLYFYDAIAPIIDADTLDRDVVFAASRYGKGDGADYLNCPMNEEQYNGFLDALMAGECMPLHSFETPKYFQGCLPIEVVAQRGRDSLRYGCMKPVGLRDPRTGKRAYAVVQLRQEDRGAQAYNMVGFQTKLKYPEQKRIFRMIPGLEQAEFLRLGAIHRNTYLDSPNLLDGRMRLKSLPNVRFAGQITGVEGYVESAAHGLLTARMLAADLQERSLPAPPDDTALGALAAHVTGAHRLESREHEPANINWSMFPNMDSVHKRQRKAARVLRAVASLEAWAESYTVSLRAGRVDTASLEAPAPRKSRAS